MTQQKLADEATIHVSFIFALETGRRDCSQAVQRRIAAALGCEVTDLLGIPDEQRLQELKDSADLRNAQAVIARLQEKKAGAA